MQWREVRESSELNCVYITVNQLLINAVVLDLPESSSATFMLFIVKNQPCFGKFADRLQIIGIRSNSTFVIYFCLQSGTDKTALLPGLAVDEQKLIVNYFTKAGFLSVE